MCSTTKSRWTWYGALMMLAGLLPFARSFIPHWIHRLVESFPRVGFCFRLGSVTIRTDEFWGVYLFLFAIPLLIYGIVCIVKAQGDSLHAHALSESVSKGTVVTAALYGASIGLSMTCMAYTINFPTSYARYPLDDFCGAVGAVAFLLLSLILLIVYVCVRRRPFVKKGFLLEIGVMFAAAIVFSWLLTVSYNFIEIWEDNHGYINTLVEKLTQ